MTNAALRIVERDFPIASNQEALGEAALLREACQAAQAYDWLIALALHLEDSTALAGGQKISQAFKTAHKCCLAKLSLCK